MSEERCETCRFWLEEKDQGIGVCRRYPPSIPVNPFYDDAISEYYSQYPCWPATVDVEWCGEYSELESDE